MAIKFFTAVASLGYAFGLSVRWRVVLCFSLLRFALVASLSAFVSSASLWVLIIFASIPGPLGFLLMYLFLIPALLMIGGLRLFDKDSRQPDPLPTAV
jgi:hypothetical protein